MIGKTSSGLYASRFEVQGKPMQNCDVINYILRFNSFPSILWNKHLWCKNLEGILLQQKRVLRIIFYLKRNDSVRHIFSELGILTVYGLYII